MPRLQHQQLKGSDLSTRFLSIFFSILLLALTVPAALTSFLLASLSFKLPNARHRKARKYAIGTPKTILITGTSTPSGLALARAFSLAGHNVIVADFGSRRPLRGWEPTKTFRRHYILRALEVGDDDLDEATYHAELLFIVRREGVDLWIPCATGSPSPSAEDDAKAKAYIEKRTSCVVLHFDENTTQLLSDDGVSLKQIEKLGMPTPKKHRVTSRNSVYRLLPPTPGHKSIITDEDEDATPAEQVITYAEPHVNGDTTELTRTSRRISPLPSKPTSASRKSTLVRLPSLTRNQTFDLIAKLPISESHPRTLYLFPKGRSYTVSALVVRGSIRTFAAYLTPTQINPGNQKKQDWIEAIPEDSALCQRFYKATESLISTYLNIPALNGTSESHSEDAETGTRAGSMTGHILIPFTVEEILSEQGIEQVVYLLPCSPRLDPLAMVLFHGNMDIVQAYMTALESLRFSRGMSTENSPLEQRRASDGDDHAPGNESITMPRKRPSKRVSWNDADSKLDEQGNPPLPAEKEERQFSLGESNAAKASNAMSQAIGAFKTVEGSTEEKIVFAKPGKKFYSLPGLLRSSIIRPLSRTAPIPQIGNFVSGLVSFRPNLLPSLRRERMQIQRLYRDLMGRSISIFTNALESLPLSPVKSLVRKSHEIPRQQTITGASVPKTTGRAQTTQSVALINGDASSVNLDDGPVPMKELVRNAWEIVARVVGPEWREIVFEENDILGSLWRLHADGLVYGRLGLDGVASS